MSALDRWRLERLTPAIRSIVIEEIENYFESQGGDEEGGGTT